MTEFLRALRVVLALAQERSDSRRPHPDDVYWDHALATVNKYLSALEDHHRRTSP